jgi:hypothetical protein
VQPHVLSYNFTNLFAEQNYVVSVQAINFKGTKGPTYSIATRTLKAQKVSLYVSPTTLHPGGTIKVHGGVSPVHTGTLYVQLCVNKVWKNAKAISITSTSYATSVAVPAGTTAVRVFSITASGYGGAYSNTVALTVR